MKLTGDEVWQQITAMQGNVFYTKKGLPFQYRIRGGEMFVDRRSKSITRSTLEKAYGKMIEQPDKITGPKALNVFGAPYVWAVLQEVIGGCKSPEIQ